MIKIRLLCILFIISSCTYSTYAINPIDGNTARISSYGGEYEGQSAYANACFMIGAADYTVRQGAKYFVILTQDTTVDSSSYTSPSVQIGTYKNGTPMMSYPSTYTSNNYSKDGVVRVFNEKPKSEYVLSYEAYTVLRNYHPQDLSRCRTGQ